MHLELQEGYILENYSSSGKEVAVIPLAIPLLAGPGSMASVLVLSNIYSSLAVGIAILLVSLISWIVVKNAQKLDSKLGKVGTNVVERVLGLLVLVMAAQFLFNGITGYINQL